MYDWLLKNIAEHFVCEKVLKETARGRVEQLRHRESGQRVICRRFLGNPEVYRKLLSVSSENLPKVLAVAEQDGQVIVLEEFITGDTLDALLREGLMDEAETREIAGGVCRALWVLHSLGAVHRDVKPENIILSGSRTVLIDFDAARLQRADSGPDTQILGTMGYAAPEQFGLAQSDARTDIYAVGVLINVMRTGEHPSRDLAPGRLGRVVTRCTQISPEQRYPDIPHLLKALQSLERSGSRRVPRWGWIAAGLAVAVLAGTLLAVRLPRGGGAEAPDSPAAPSVLADSAAAPLSLSEPEPAVQQEGRVFDTNAALLDYEDDSGRYTVFAHFAMSSSNAEDMRSMALPRDSSTGILTHVNVLDSKEQDVSVDFREKVEAVTMEATTLSGEENILTVRDWGVYEDFPNVLYTGELQLHGADSVGGITWTLTMKNGDTLVLHQSVQISPLQKTVYDEVNADLSSMEALNQLLETIEELPEDMLVDIHLPAIRYEGELVLKNHAVNLYGTIDGDAVTTFTGTVTQDTCSPDVPEFQGIRFEGSGGTGVYSTKELRLLDCTFVGWDTAVYMGNGSFVLTVGCTFENNGVGLYFDSEIAGHSSPSIPNNTFVGNETAVLLERVPIAEALRFEGCAFRQNGTDVDNRAGHRVDMSGAVVE